MKVILTSVKCKTNYEMIEKYPYIKNFDYEDCETVLVNEFDDSYEYLILRVDKIEDLFDIYDTVVIKASFEYGYYGEKIEILHALLKDGYIE